MNMTKLYKGLIVKNYKELCNLLDEKVKTGGSKNIQLRNWKDYFEFHKEGNKFVIDEILTNEKEITIERKSQITELEEIKRLIMFYMYSNGDGDDKVCYPTIGQLGKACYLVNGNYTVCKNHQKATSEITEVDENIVFEYFTKLEDKLEYRILKALESLRKCFLINYKRTYMVVHLDTKDEGCIIETKEGEFTEERKVKQKHIPATDEELKLITDISYKYLRMCGCETMQEAIRKDKYKTIMNAIKIELRDEYNIGYFYNVYEIRYNKQHVKNDLINKNLTSEEIEELATIVNEAFSLSMDKSVIKAHEEALLNNSKKYGYRKKDTYIGDNKKLKETVVDKDAINFNDLVKLESNSEKELNKIKNKYGYTAIDKMKKIIQEQEEVDEYNQDRKDEQELNELFKDVLDDMFN